MKKLLSTLILCLCALCGVQAQIEGGSWYNGSIQYSAEKMENGNFWMTAMDEGEEHAFTMMPVAGKPDTYHFTDTDYVRSVRMMVARFRKVSLTPSLTTRST